MCQESHKMWEGLKTCSRNLRNSYTQWPLSLVNRVPVELASITVGNKRRGNSCSSTFATQQKPTGSTKYRKIGGASLPSRSGHGARRADAAFFRGHHLVAQYSLVFRRYSFHPVWYMSVWILSWIRCSSCSNNAIWRIPTPAAHFCTPLSPNIPNDFASTFAFADPLVMPVPASGWKAPWSSRPRPHYCLGH